MRGFDLLLTLIVDLLRCTAELTAVTHVPLGANNSNDMSHSHMLKSIFRLIPINFFCITSAERKMADVQNYL